MPKIVPNILLITDDQHRFDMYDNRTVSSLRTPNFQRLMKEGAVLTNTYSNCPVCMATRFTWLYGLYATQASFRLASNAYDWPTDLPSMGHSLQEAGYHTALIGKLHSKGWLTPPRDLLDFVRESEERGFDDVFETCGKSLTAWYDCNWTHHLKEKGLLEKYREDCKSRLSPFGGKEHYEPSVLKSEDSMDGFTGTKVRQWLESYEGEKPFFLHASFCGPHFPLDPLEKYFNKYKPEDMPDPIGVDDPQQIARWKEHMALYCGLVEQVDDEVGRVMDVLEKKGIFDDTVIFYACDHGDMLGHKGMGHKTRPYDTSCRTPYIVRYPSEIKGAQVLEGMTEAVDLPLSILHAAGIEDPEASLPETPGRSFWDYVRGQAGEHRKAAYSEFANSWRMVVSDNWKYIFRRAGNRDLFSKDIEDELYDLENDPWELENRINDPSCSDRISRMRLMIIDSMANCAAPNRDEKKFETINEYRNQKYWKFG